MQVYVPHTDATPINMHLKEGFPSTKILLYGSPIGTLYSCFPADNHSENTRKGHVRNASIPKAWTT